MNEYTFEIPTPSGCESYVAMHSEGEKVARIYDVTEGFCEVGKLPISSVRNLYHIAAKTKKPEKLAKIACTLRNACCAV